MAVVCPDRAEIGSPATLWSSAYAVLEQARERSVPGVPARPVSRRVGAPKPARGTLWGRDPRSRLLRPTGRRSAFGAHSRGLFSVAPMMGLPGL